MNMTDQKEILSNKHKLAIISDGSSVFNLGDIGPDESRKFLEEKAESYNKLNQLNAVAIPIETTSTANFAKIIKSISPGFDCIDLEFIKEETLVELDTALGEVLDIPLYNFRFKGMPILTLAALYRGLKITEKNIEDIKIIINGTGKLSMELVNLFIAAGVKNILMLDEKGIISPLDDDLDSDVRLLAGTTNPELLSGDLEVALDSADSYIDVNNNKEFKEAYLGLMNENPIIINLNYDRIASSQTIENYRQAAIYYSFLEGLKETINTNILASSIIEGLIESQTSKISTEMMIETAQLIFNEDIDPLNGDKSQENIEDLSIKQKITDNIIEKASKQGKR